MTDKLTDKEIIKALECCIKWEREGDCAKCPLWESKKLCVKEIRKQSLDLINRLQADVENYKQVAEHQQSVTMDRGFEIKRLKEKIESLQAENERLKNHIQEGIDLAKQIPKMIELVKAEAYKECIEKVKERLSTCVTDTQQMVVELRLDNLLKELVGEDK